MWTTWMSEVLIRRRRGAGTQATMWELGHGCGKALDCVQDSMDDKHSVLAMAGERETRDGLIAIFANSTSVCWSRRFRTNSHI
jgi:sarcosine oxidase delta subunit